MNFVACSQARIEAFEMPCFSACHVHLDGEGRVTGRVGGWVVEGQKYSLHKSTTCKCHLRVMSIMHSGAFRVCPEGGLSQ